MPMNPRLLRPLARLQAPPAGTPASLLLNFDGNFNDSSASSIAVTANGGAATSTAQSKFGGQSLAIADNPDSLSFAPGAALTFTGDFTIEAWVYLTAVPQFYAGLIEARSGALGEQFACGMRNVSGTARLDFYTPTGAITGDIEIPTGEWVHIAFVRSGSTISAFANGVQDAGQATVSGTISPTGATAYIGRLPFDNWTFSGYIDDFRIVNGLAIYGAEVTHGDFVPPSAALSANATPYTNYKPYGTLLFSGCDGIDLVGTYADGAGGRYTEVISEGTCE